MSLHQALITVATTASLAFAVLTPLALGGGDPQPRPIIGQPAVSTAAPGHVISPPRTGCKQSSAFSGSGVSFIGNPLPVGHCPNGFESPPLCPLVDTFELQVTDLGDDWEVRISCVPPGVEAVLFAGLTETGPPAGPFAQFKGCDLVPTPDQFLLFTTAPLVISDTVLTFAEPDDRCDVPEGIYFQVFVKQAPGNWGATNAVFFFGQLPPGC